MRANSISMQGPAYVTVEDRWPYTPVTYATAIQGGLKVRRFYTPQDIAQVERRRVLFAPIATPSLASTVYHPVHGAGGFAGYSCPSERIQGGQRHHPMGSTSNRA